VTAGQAPVLPADSLRTLIDSVLAGPAYQQYAPRDPWAPVRRAWAALMEWIDRLRETNPGAYEALIWGLVLILLAIVAHAAWVAARTIRAGTTRAPGTLTEVAAIPRDAAWYAAEARRLAGGEQYAEAMQADFLRLVLELDARDVTRYHPSKTPVEYARDARLPEEARDRLRQLIRTLYRHAFAREPADAATWDSWRADANVNRYASAR
jgi:hypothetical protein